MRPYAQVPSILSVLILGFAGNAFAVCDKEINALCVAEIGALGSAAPNDYLAGCTENYNNYIAANNGRLESEMSQDLQAFPQVIDYANALRKCVSSPSKGTNGDNRKNKCSGPPSFVFRPVLDQNTNICTFNVDNNSPYQISCTIAYPNGGSRLLPVSAGQSNFEGWPLSDLGGQCSATVTCKKAAHATCQKQ